MGAKEVRHPLVQHNIGLIRKEATTLSEFRALTKQIGTMLTYEATRDIALSPAQVTGWAGSIDVECIDGHVPTVVPILRAGLGMMEGVLAVLPDAPVSVVGIYRDEETLEPVPYFDKLVHDISERTALIIDPMLATGGSLLATVDLLVKAGCSHIKVLVLVAAPEGIAAVHARYPDLEIYTAAIDDRLNENGYIIPGLGDAGDKIFGTREP